MNTENIENIENTENTENIENIENTENKSNITILEKPISYYEEFRNTTNLPTTKIIKIIEDDYPEYLLNESNKELSLLDIFDINYSTSLGPIKGNFIGTDIKNNMNFSFDKFISYLVYTKSKHLLKENTENDSYTFNLSQLKYQIGKDIIRINLYVNDEKQNFVSFTGGNTNTSENIIYNNNNNEISSTPQINTSDMYQGEEEPEKNELPNEVPNEESNEVSNEESNEVPNEELSEVSNEESNEVNYYEITDKYFELLLQNYGNKYINYNIINEIGILSCQNIINFLSELIQILIKNITTNTLINDYIIVSPTAKKDSNDVLTISNPKKLSLIINEKNKILSVYFDSYLFNSSDFIKVGRVTFELSIDLLSNEFKFNTLNIDYNLENIISSQTNNGYRNTRKVRPNIFVRGKNSLTRKINRALKKLSGGNEYERSKKVRKLKNKKTKKVRKLKNKKSKKVRKLKNKKTKKNKN